MGMGSTSVEIEERGLLWDSVLHCGIDRITVWHEVAPNGMQTGPGRAAAGHGDEPMWRGQGAESWSYIGELGLTHRARLFRWIMLRAWSIEFSVGLAEIGGPFAPMGDHACDAFEQMHEERSANPWLWLLETPFMQALAALLIGDGQRGLVEAWERVAYAGVDRERSWYDLHIEEFRERRDLAEAAAKVQPILVDEFDLLLI